MTGLLILTFVPAAAAILFWLRVREQRHELEALRERLAGRGAPGSDAGTGAGDHPSAGAADAAGVTGHDLFGTVAHELRSPIAAILGYQELLSEGVLGPVDERMAEALVRIRSSARQLLALTDGMHVLSGRERATPGRGPIDFRAALDGACARIADDAAARRVTLTTAPPPTGPDAAGDPAGTASTGEGDADAIDAILDAALGAAVKSSTERTVHTAVEPAADVVHLRLYHTGVPADTFDDQPLASGVGLRLVIARQMARRLGGDVRLVPEPGRAAAGVAGPATTVDVALPRRGPAGGPARDRD